MNKFTLISRLSHISLLISTRITAQKMRLSMKVFSGKCDQICSFLWILSHLMKKSFLENFIYFEENGFHSVNGLGVLPHIINSSLLFKATFQYPVRIYLFKDNNGKTRTTFETCSKLTIKTVE